jgi:hypothetical protein
MQKPKARVPTPGLFVTEVLANTASLVGNLEKDRKEPAVDEIRPYNQLLSQELGRDQRGV